MGTSPGRPSAGSRRRLTRLRRLLTQDHHVTSSRNRPYRPKRPRRHHGPKLPTTPHSLKLRSHRPMVGLAQLPSPKRGRSQRLPISHKTPLQLSKKLIPKHRPTPRRHASQSVTRTSKRLTTKCPPHPNSDIYVGCLFERNWIPAGLISTSPSST